MASMSCPKTMHPFCIAFTICYEMSNVLHSKINNISILILHCSGCKKYFCRMIMPNGLFWQSARQLCDMRSAFSSYEQHYSFQNMDLFRMEEM